MQKCKEKMYNYEVDPPPECWTKISTLLDDEKSNRFYPRKKNIDLYYRIAVAATVTILVFSLIFWFNKNSVTKNEITQSNLKNDSVNTREDDNVSSFKITVPKITPDNKAFVNENKSKTSKLSEKKLAETNDSKYITIAGPQGQAVKISSKAAALIVSSDDQNPPKPVWNAKVQKWKDIMKANILTATTADFLDIVELTHALTMNNR